MAKNQQGGLTDQKGSEEPARSSGQFPKKHIYKPIPKFKGCKNC